MGARRTRRNSHLSSHSKSGTGPQRESSSSGVSHTSASRRPLSRGRALAVVGLLALVAVVGMRDVRRPGPDPIDECTEYLSLVETCMGKATATRLSASFAKPPRDEAKRAAMGGECTKSRDRLKKACR